MAGHTRDRTVHAQGDRGVFAGARATPATLALARAVSTLPNFFTARTRGRGALSPRADAESQAEYSRAIVVFMHVNKAGGTTIKKAIDRRLEQRRREAGGAAPRAKAGTVESGRVHCFTKNAYRWRAEKALMGEVQAADGVIVDGDYCMGVCDLVTSARPCTYVTMLREPRERTASSYLYCQRKPDDQLCATHLLDARNASFEQWVPHQGNYMTQMLLFDVRLAVPPDEQLER